MRNLEGITAELEQTPIIDETLQARVCNQRRDNISIKVGWSAMDILRAEAPQRRIETYGVGICYVIFGTNQNGDVILGHYAPSVSRETALELARHLINQQNLVNEKRQLNYDNFTFGFIQGPSKFGEMPIGYYDVYYDRDEGLVATKFLPGPPKNGVSLTIYDKNNPLNEIIQLNNLKS